MTEQPSRRAIIAAAPAVAALATVGAGAAHAEITADPALVAIERWRAK